MKQLNIYHTAFIIVVLVFRIVCEQSAGEEGSHEHTWEDHDDLDFMDFFSDENTEDDKHLEQHIKDDIGLDNLNVDNMTESEKDWYYYKLHDADDDYRLDGLEILKAWQHHYLEHMGSQEMDHYNTNSTEAKEKWIQEQEKLYVEMVDQILTEQDLNYDGYLDYYEYMTAKERAEKEAKRREEENKKANGDTKKENTKPVTQAK